MNEKTENPIIISVVGPRRVGKSTFINSIISYYSSNTEYKEEGCTLIFTKEKNSLLFLESPSDKLSMINLAKASDIVILVIDCYFGLELETFEFLSLSVSHGCPRVLCILTHLDLFEDWKCLRKAKKRIKKRLKLELNIHSKIFFFSGITFKENYLTREISNFTRYLSSVFIYPSALQKNSSYIVISAIRINITSNNQKVLLFGFAKGKTYKNLIKFYSYVPGIGDIDISNLYKQQFEKNNKIIPYKHMLEGFDNFFSKLKNNVRLLIKLNFLFIKKNIKRYTSFYFIFYQLFNKKKISAITKTKFKYLESNKFFFNNKMNDCSTLKSLLEKKNRYDDQIEFGDFLKNSINEKHNINKKKKFDKNFINSFKILESNSFPNQFKKYYDPSYPIVIQIKYQFKDKTLIIKAKITKHKWNKNLLRSKYSYIISIGWKIFKTFLIIFKEDSLNRKRYQKYLCRDTCQLVCFYSTFVEIGTVVIGINEENVKIRSRTQGANFDILFTGNVLSNNSTLNIFKKAKLKGTVYNSFRKTAFVKNMFSNEMEIFRFMGSLIQTISGTRGIIKKYSINGPSGSFRATFEKNVMDGEIVFLRIWFPVEIYKKLEYKNFFELPNDLREMNNENFINCSDYLEYLKKKYELKILKNFGI